MARNSRLDRWVEIKTGGVVEVRTGKVEIGQGITSALAQIAAEELDVDYGRIRMIPCCWSPLIEGTMEQHHVVALRSLTAALPDISRMMLDGQAIRTGRDDGRIGLRPREIVANWVLCTVLDHIQGQGRFTLTSDPLQGDGIIHDRQSGRAAPTEHVMVASARDREGVEIHQRILDAIQSKVDRGPAYGAGKTLVVLSEATGVWFPNRVARQLLNPLHFSDVWVIALQAPTRPYVYGVTYLDISSGDTPTWKVSLDQNFSSWTVAQVQQ